MGVFIKKYFNQYKEKKLTPIPQKAIHTHLCE